MFIKYIKTIQPDTTLTAQIKRRLYTYEIHEKIRNTRVTIAAAAVKVSGKQKQKSNQTKTQ